MRRYFWEYVQIACTSTFLVFVVLFIVAITHQAR